MIYNRPQVITLLRSHARGEIPSSGLTRFLAHHRFESLRDLLQIVRLRAFDFRDIALDRSVVQERMRAFLSGELGFREFQHWVGSQYQVHAQDAYPMAPTFDPDVECALMLLALCTDVAVTESARTSRLLVHFLSRSTEEGQGRIPAAEILAQLYRSKRRVHLVTHDRDEKWPSLPDWPSSSPQWARLALLNPRFFGTTGPCTASYWFIPLTVCTRRHWLANPTRDAWAHPENDKIHALRDRVESGGISRESARRFQDLVGEYSPRYYEDPYGLSEVVLEVDSLDQAGLEAAAALFCLNTGTSACYLDGRRVFPMWRNHESQSTVWR